MATLQSGGYADALTLVKNMIAIVLARSSYFDQVIDKLLSALVHITQICTTSIKSSAVPITLPGQPAPPPPSVQLSMDTREDLIDLRKLTVEFIVVLISSSDAARKLSVQGQDVTSMLFGLFVEIMLSFTPDPAIHIERDV